MVEIPLAEWLHTLENAVDGLPDGGCFDDALGNAYSALYDEYGLGNVEVPDVPKSSAKEMYDWLTEIGVPFMGSEI